MAGRHANVDYGRDAGGNSLLWAIAGTVRRPNTTFRTISHDPGRYLASSVAIFAIVCLGAILLSAVTWFEPNNGIINNFDNGMLAYALSLIKTVLLNLLIIVTIFWIGGGYGAGHKFKDMFPVLSYCLIPMAFFAAASLGMQLLDLPGYLHSGSYLEGGSLDPNPSMSPSYGLDFAGSLAINLTRNAFPAFFMVWAFVLFVKATKISRKFGTGKAVGVVALAVTVSYTLAGVLAFLEGFFLGFLLL